MTILKLSQTNDREAWMEARRGVITGSKSKGLKPLTRGADRTPAGFWELLAENLAIAKDGEPERDRGHRLENDGVKAVAKRFKIKFNTDPGMWISDEESSIGVSPDGAEEGDKPTYAAEVKCLDSKNHLKAIVMDVRAKKEPGYNPINSLVVSTQCDFKHQALQYFVVNEHLEKLYFAFHDDRIVLDNIVTYTIVITRKDVEDLAVAQYEQQKDVLVQVKQLIKELKQL